MDLTRSLWIYFSFSRYFIADETWNAISVKIFVWRTMYLFDRKYSNKDPAVKKEQTCEEDVERTQWKCCVGATFYIKNGVNKKLRFYFLDNENNTLQRAEKLGEHTINIRLVIFQCWLFLLLSFKNILLSERILTRYLLLALHTIQALYNVCRDFSIQRLHFQSR